MAGGSAQPPTSLPPVTQRGHGLLTRVHVSLRLRRLDLIDRLAGRRDALTPPRRMSQYVGHGDFAAVGAEFLALMRAHADLAPSDRVLDVGCGIGRMARVLSSVLRPPGSYDGFDVARTGIEWCRRHYRDQPAPFRFTHVDLANATYNPRAAATAASFRFPYADDSFDLVIATSVFTHLLPEESSNYLAEIGRVLAPSGRLFSTWFLLDSEDETPPPPFRNAVRRGAALIADPATPSAAVAYPLAFLDAPLGAGGLAAEPVRWGSWRSGHGTSVQDLVIARRL